MRVLRSVIIPAVLGLVTAAGFASSAAAKCEVTGEIFYMHENDVRKNVARTTAMHGCDLHFITRKGVRFISAKIVDAPDNGNLRKLARLEFRYKPKKDFKGTDKFVLEVCGRTPKGKGCSTLHYDAIVE